MEFKTLNKVNDGESARTQQYHCVVRVMKALRTPGICGKGVMVEDSSQIIITTLERVLMPQRRLAGVTYHGLLLWVSHWTRHLRGRLTGFRIGFTPGLAPFLGG